MNIDVPRFDTTVDRLLEAALVPSSWSSVLEDIADASGARGLCVLPVVGRHPGVPATESIEGGLAAYFDEGWQFNDFRERGLPHLMRNGTVLEQDFASRDDVEKALYYKFLDKYRLGWSAMVGFRNGEDLLCLVIQRSRQTGPFSREEETRFRTIRSRLSLATSIMRALSNERTNGIAQAFDMASLGCVFFDRHGNVSQFNACADRLLGDGLTIKKKEIRAARPQDTLALRLRIRAVTRPDLVCEPADCEPAVVHRTGGKKPLVVRMQRLPGSLHDLFAHSVAVAVIEDLEERPLAPGQTLRHLFSLTAAESTVARHLAAGLPVREIADRSGISYETARGYLKSIYRKTGTDRQAELAALLAKLRLV